jgi:hypothetical protein
MQQMFISSKWLVFRRPDVAGFGRSMTLIVVATRTNGVILPERASISSYPFAAIWRE